MKFLFKDWKVLICKNLRPPHPRMVLEQKILKKFRQCYFAISLSSLFRYFVRLSAICRSSFLDVHINFKAASFLVKMNDNGQGHVTKDRDRDTPSPTYCFTVSMFYTVRDGIKLHISLSRAFGIFCLAEVYVLSQQCMVIFYQSMVEN